MADVTALNTVYNHFLTTYAPKGTNTKYDTHKKSELRGVYNSIVKMNIDAPLYLPVTSASTQQYAVGLKEDARSLKNTISSLSLDDSENMLDQKAVASSNKDIVSATYIGSAEDAASAPDLSIEIKRLAQNQVNSGNFMNPDEMELEPGTYSFDVHSRDMDYEFQFNISEGDTNKFTQEKLSRLINRSNIGIHSEVQTDSAGNTALILSSDDTGVRSNNSTLFDVTDDRTSKMSGVVDYFGIGNVSQYPDNSSFILNGVERSTFANTFTIDRTYELNLKDITADDEPVSIGLKTDTESIAENISHLVEGYNSFINKVSAYLDTQPYSGRLVGEMSGISSLYGSELESIGMHVGEDGRISLNKDMLQQTAGESDAMEKFDSIRNFTGSILDKMNKVSLNPMDYTQRTIVAYKNPGHSFASPYVTSNYSGMMFSSYC